MNRLAFEVVLAALSFAAGARYKAWTVRALVLAAGKALATAARVEAEVRKEIDTLKADALKAVTDLATKL